MRVSTSLCLKFRDANTAETVRAALLPEILDFKTPRSEVSIEIEGERLLLSIRTDDVSSLRATLNSYLRWILCADETIGILREIVPADVDVIEDL